MMLGLAVPGKPQAVATPTGPPDVLVIVIQRPGLGDQVGVTYAQTVPRGQAQHDLQAFAQAAGLTPQETEIVDGPSPVKGRTAKMTSMSFMAPGVIQTEVHAFPLEALIGAFRGYKRLNFIFITDSRFQFQGLRQYADNHVRLTLEQHGSAYTYQVQVLSANFDLLNLPPSDIAAQQSGGIKTVSRSPLLIFLGVLAAAGAAALLIFFLMTRIVTKG